MPQRLPKLHWAERRPGDTRQASRPCGAQRDARHYGIQGVGSLRSLKRRRPIGERLQHAFREEVRASQASEPAIPKGRSGEMRAYLARRRAKNSERRAVALPVEGSESRCPESGGPYWVRRLEYAPSTPHGTRSLALQLGPDHWRRIGEWARDAVSTEAVTLADCLFLDTETTGLSGGAGTTVFMVGLGFFEGEQFVVEQLFLRGFGEEPAMLRHVARRWAEHPLPVSFVGKSFDRHRIHARLVLHGIEAPVLQPQHLDLYYLARRAYGEQLPNVRLQTLEKRILGVHRTDDLPGSQAPRAFVDWLRDGTGPVDRVFEHNRLDVLSLVTLLGALARAD